MSGPAADGLAPRAPKAGSRRAALEGRRGLAWLGAAYRDRLTSRGRYLAWVAVACALLGVDTRRSQTFVLFAGASAMLLTASAWVALGRRGPPVRLECEVPPRAIAGRAVRLCVELSAERDVDLELTLPTAAPEREPGAIGATGVTLRKTRVRLAAGERATVATELRLARRGRHEVWLPRARGLDPLGLATSRASAPVTAPLLVRPRTYPTPLPPFDGARAQRPRDAPSPRARDEGAELLGTRPYRAGDPRGRIHWRSFARRGQPIVKELAAERAGAAALVLDGGDLAGDDASFEAAVSVAASLAEACARGGVPLSTLVTGARAYPLRGGDATEAIDLLACATPTPDPPSPTLARAIADAGGGVAAVLAVVLDWDEPRQRLFRALRAQGASVWIVVVRAGGTTLPQIEEPGIRLHERLTPAAVEARLRAAEAA